MLLGNKKNDEFNAQSHTWKKSSAGFPISLLRLILLSMQTLWTYLVLGGVHPGTASSNFFCNFSKYTGDVPLWKIISRDPLGRFGWKYACCKIVSALFSCRLRGDTIVKLWGRIYKTVGESVQPTRKYIVLPDISLWSFGKIS